MVDPIFGSLITAAAIVGSAAVAIFMAKYSSGVAKEIARTKTTYETLNQKAWDKDYIRAKILFQAARDADGGNSLVEEAKAQKANPEPQNSEMSTGSAIRLIMNDYERTFVALELGVLDEEFLKLWHRKTIIDDYNKTKSYVEWVRSEKGNPRLYEVFQRNARRWEEDFKRSS